MKIAYFGYDFLIDCLKLIEGSDHEILKIFTFETDEEYESNCKICEFADKRGIKRSTKRVGKEDIEQLKEEGCELLISAGYIWRIPTGIIKGINIHPSLLPEGRGVWPMPNMILMDEKKGGVSIHKLEEEFDKGDILIAEQFPIERKETLTSLETKIKQTSPDLLKRCLADFDWLWRNAKKQEGGSYWEEPKAEEAIFSPEMDIEVIDRIVRAFYGYQCFLKIGNDTTVIRKAYCVPGRHKETLGAIREEGEIKICPVKGGHVVFGSDEIQTYTYRPICMKDRERMNRILMQNNNTMSTFTFPVLYLWQDILGYQIHLEEDFFSIQIGDEGDRRYMFPMGNPVKQLEFLKWCSEHETLGKSTELVFISDQDAELLQQFGWKADIQEDRRYYDYIGSCKEYVAMQGKQYRHIRKAIHKYRPTHELHMEEITEENLNIVLNINRQWEEMNHVTLQEFSDQAALKRIIGNYKALNLEGALFKEDGDYIGFIIASQLAPGMLDIHFAKNIVKDQGVGYYSKHLFLAARQKSYECYNMEEDLGIEGIRTHKMLLNPIYLQKSYKTILGRRDNL